MIFIFQAALCKVLLYWLILHLLIIFIYHQMGKWSRKYHHPNFKISKYKITLNACLIFILCFSCINQNCHFIEIKYYIHKTNFSPSTSKFSCSCQREIFASESIYNNLQCCVPYPRVVHWILFHWFSVNNQDWKKCLQISMGEESTQYLCLSNLNSFSHKNIKNKNC